MKNAFALLALFLCVAASATAADALPGQPMLSPQPAVSTAAEAAPDLDALLADLAGQQPVSRATSCEESVYESCMLYCYDLSQNNGCGFYASQACLCMRAPADCPVCY